MDLIKSNNHKTLSNISSYHSTEKLKAIGLNSKGISQLVATLLKIYKHEFQENLSDSILNKHAFLNRKLTFEEIHFPSSYQKLKNAINNLNMRNYFFTNCFIKTKKIRQQKTNPLFLVLSVKILIILFQSS